MYRNGPTWRLERKKFRKKWTVSGTYEKILNGLPYISLDSQKERWEIMAEKKKTFQKTITNNFPNLVKYVSLQIQKGCQTPNRINSKKTMSRYIIFKLMKRKDKN